MLNPDSFQVVSGVRPVNGKSGGQELILFEVLALLLHEKRVWLPFYSSGTLAIRLQALGVEVRTDPDRNTYSECPVGCTAVYFGTPTIVNDGELFPDFERWTKTKEREVVKWIVQKAVANGCRLIISGLGSGDISVDERLEDMGGGSIACFKNFTDFKDYVLVRIIG